ncbi:MAG: IS5 family transposase [Desulfobacteraceae bacterium]|nr:IS5 family transposase [Desulfobacteraceae bacterium]
MLQTGLFDWHDRLGKLDKNEDPLTQLDKLTDWERFRPIPEQIRKKKTKRSPGPKYCDVIMMFKVLILQSLYNLSDDAVEFQILDRLSFMRFLKLNLGDRVPDSKTIWLFREQLGKAKLVNMLFAEFNAFLKSSGCSAKKGQIVDASIVSAPEQRNSRDENNKIKQGEVPKDWKHAKKRQKDTDARWTKKNRKSCYGYKNHISVDVKHKIIRTYEVTDASVHDSTMFEELLDDSNSSRDVWADSAYRSKDSVRWLKKQNFREHLQRKGSRNKKLTEWEKQGNKTRSKIRSRVEHIFGVQTMTAGNLILRTIGFVRARAKIGLRNLAYNMNRYKILSGNGI